MIITPPIDRRQFFKALTAMASLGKRANSALAVFLVDIRDFKRINRSYGFACGDQVLCEVYQRLLALNTDTAAIHRIGEDTFAVSILVFTGSSSMGLMVNRILTLFHQPMTWYEHALSIQVQIGGAAQAAQDINVQELTLRAEVALEEAKEANIPYRLLDDDSPQGQQHWQLERDIIEALNNNELELFFQPQLDLKAGQVFSVEALIRWRSERYGLVTPDRILPTLTRANRMMDLTRFAINNALRVLSMQMAQSTIRSVSVNLPAELIHLPEMVDIVTNALQIWDVEAERLTLEITEYALIKDQQSSYHNLSRLRALGTQIAIDDFGTGYSSLAYFKELPADELKIDRSFIMNMEHSEADRNIVQLITELAHKFGLRVVAEGVETPDTLSLLSALQCNHGQGYLFSRPLPVDELMRWIETFDLSSTPPQPRTEPT